jgi:glucose-6-phosphate 1-dehydrogenase
VEEAWRIVDPILDKPNVSAYQPGTWGPAEAAKLIAPYGGWFDPK